MTTIEPQEENEAQDRQNLGQELEGLEGLIYRIGTAFDANGMHAAALAVVCESIFLARQVMQTDKVDHSDVENLLGAITDLEKKGVEWKIAALQQQIWPLLPEHLRPAEGPTRIALEFALHEWLTRGETEGKAVAQLAEEFTAFCADAPKPAKPAKKRKG